MATLQLSAHFWTLRDDVAITDFDLGAFKYQANKDAESITQYGSLKKSLCQSRDKTFIPSNRRPARLKDTLIEFEEILSHQTVVHVEWSSVNQGNGFIFFSNGCIVHLIVDLHQTDVTEIIIDHSLEGKLLSDICSVGISRELLVLAHGIPHLTVIETSSPLFSSDSTALLNQCLVSVNGIQLPGPGTRRQERKVSISPDNSSICVWWEREGSELFAWAPVVKMEDRANILVYSAVGNDLLASYYTEYNVINVEFCAKDSRLLRITELVSTHTKGRLTVRSTLFSFHLNQSLKRVQQRQLKIPALLRCHSYSPDEQILLLGCVDASIISWDLTRDTVSIYRSSFIPFHLNWHETGSLFTVTGERGQLQCCDRALQPLLLRMPGAADGSSILHLQQYMRGQPAVINVKWATIAQQSSSLRSQIAPPTAKRQKSMRSKRKPFRAHSKPLNSDRKTPVQHLLICFERGPILCLRFLTSCWPSPGNSINSLALCCEYVNWQQWEFAVQHLLSLRWAGPVESFQEEDTLLGCFIKVVNGLLLQSGPVTESLLVKAVNGVLDSARGDDQLLEPVLDAARRSCRLLLRRQRLQQASVFAFRLHDVDLLVELILYARKAQDEALTNQAMAVLDLVRDEYSSASSSGSSSHASSYLSTSSSSSSTCSTCDHHQELSNLRLDDDEDQVHVISFGVV